MVHGSSTARLTRKIRSRAAEWINLGADAGAVLQGLDASTEVVYLIGDPPAAGWLTWALQGLDGGAWEPGGHYLNATAPVLRYTGPGGRKVELHRASNWFGAGTYTPSQAASAWAMLGVHVGRAFPGSTLLATPATTGRELFLRTIPYGREWPVLDADTQALIRATDGQGRTEVVANGARLDGAWHPFTQLPALYEYDGRLMYAALCWGLPMGVPQRDTRDEYAGYTRARYRVRGTVPRDWSEGFGLLGVQRDDGSRLWRYPAEPGEPFETWCDGAELHVALAAGWRPTILERLIWADHAGKGKGPLDTWAAKLIAVRDQCDFDARMYEGHDDLMICNRLAANAVRALLLHGIGSFHARPHVVTHYQAVDAGPIPAAAVNVRLEGDWIVYGIEGEPPADGSWMARLAHPEWCAAIWARARARLLSGPQNTGALHRTAGDVVAFRTDAIYFTAPQAWHDDTRPGRLRLKTSRTGPWPWPTNGTDLLRIRDAS